MERVLLLSAVYRPKITITCFGHFQLFKNGIPLAFRSQKAKELLAILIDKKGTIVTPEEAFSLIWEDKTYNNYTGSAYRKALTQLQKELKKAGCEDILIRTPGGCAINRTAVTCDYYQYLDGQATWFPEEYMSDYSWAEYTLAGLAMRSNTKQIG